MEQREDSHHASKRAKAELSKEDELKLLREEVAHLEKRVSENKLKILGNIFFPIYLTKSASVVVSNNAFVVFADFYGVILLFIMSLNLYFRILQRSSPHAKVWSSPILPHPTIPLFITTRHSLP